MSNKDDIVDVTHGFGQTLLQMVREWRAGQLGRPAPSQEMRLRNEYTVMKVATCSVAIADGAEGDVVLEEGEDGVAREGDTVKVRNLSGRSFVSGETVAVTWPVKGRWVILPAGQGVANFPGLTNSECQCGKSVRGREVGDCSACKCINPVRRTALPLVMSLDFDAWPEVQTIAELQYEGNCQHKSRRIFGIPCQVEGEGEDLVVVRDEYQFIVDYAAGIAELKCVTESPQCLPVIYIRWVFCPNCAKQCTSTWRLKLDIYENCFVENCEICITPLKDRTQTEIPCTSCPPEVKFVLPGEVQLRIFDHPVPSTKMCGVELDPENPEGPGIPGHTISPTYDQCHFNGKHLLKRPTNKEGLWIAADYGLEAGWKQTIELDIIDFLESPVGDLVMCGVVWSKQFIRSVCNNEPPCPAEVGFIPNSIVHQQWTWLQLEDGDKWRIRAYLRAGESSSESCGFFRTSHYQSAKAYTCEELKSLQDFDPENEDAPEVELVFVEGFDGIGPIEPLPSLWFSFQIPGDDPAPSSGHTGASCGPPEEEPCKKPCRVRVVAVTIGDVTQHAYKIIRNKGCGTAFCTCAGMEAEHCGGFVTNLPDHGPASEKPIGWEGNVPCLATPANIGTDSVRGTFAAMEGLNCHCAQGVSVLLCLNAETGRYESAPITLCGATIPAISLYESGGTWYVDGIGEGGSAPSIEGPFVIGAVGTGCEGLQMTVTE